MTFATRAVLRNQFVGSVMGMRPRHGPNSSDVGAIIYLKKKKKGRKFKAPRAFRPAGVG